MSIFKFDQFWSGQKDLDKVSRIWEVSFREPGRRFPGNRKSVPGNQEVSSQEPGSQFPRAGMSVPGNREVSSREPGSQFPGTGKSVHGNREVSSREPGSQFPETGKSVPENLIIWQLAEGEEGEGEGEERWLIDLLASPQVKNRQSSGQTEHIFGQNT